MNSQRQHSLWIAAFIAIFGLPSLTASAQNIYNYDPGLGTLPEAQGFIYSQSGSFPEPTVANGVMRQYASDGGGIQQYWQAQGQQLNFATGAYVIEAVVRVLAARDANPGMFGFQLEAIDSVGRIVTLSVSTNAVGLGGTSISLQSTGEFHTNRVEIANGQATLFIDGIQRTVVPIEICCPQPQFVNRVYFGDGGSIGECDAEIRSIRIARQLSSIHMAIDVSEVRVCWNSESNQTYDIQFRSVLTSNNWLDLQTNFLATTSSTCVFDRIAPGQPQRFYRVLKK